MKRLLFFLLLIPSLLPAQKLSEFPLYFGNPTGYWLPIFDLHSNRKIDANVFFNTQLATKSTSDVGEGLNLYFTTSRARGAMAAGYGVLYDPSTGMYRLDTTVTNAKYTTNFILGPTLNYNGEVLEVTKTKLARSTHVVADANYTIDENDEVIVLPNPTATRTVFLPAASTMQGLTITIIGAFDVTGEWLLSGSFVQYGTVSGSPFTENFINSGLSPNDRIRLTSIIDGGTWRWFDTK